MAESRVQGVHRGREIAMTIDGERVAAHEGETVAMALWAAGRPMVRRSAKLGAPRGVFCNMGICYDCLVYVDGGRGPAVRSCMLPVEDGMELTTWGPETGEGPRAT